MPAVAQATLCSKNGVQLERDKVECGTELVFARMLLKAAPGGLEVTPDPSRIQAIRDYPVPTDLESLRRFLGLSE